MHCNALQCNVKGDPTNNIQTSFIQNPNQPCLDVLGYFLIESMQSLIIEEAYFNRALGPPEHNRCR